MIANQNAGSILRQNCQNRRSKTGRKMPPNFYEMLTRGTWAEFFPKLASQPICIYNFPARQTKP
jgi:hypothetical protein